MVSSFFILIVGVLAGWGVSQQDHQRRGIPLRRSGARHSGAGLVAVDGTRCRSTSNWHLISLGAGRRESILNSGLEPSRRR
jgi:hypothetical protein